MFHVVTTHTILRHIFPWRRDDVTMPPSKGTALQRLRKIQQKMDAEPDFAEQYSAQVDLLKKGYVVPYGGIEHNAVCWYLPYLDVKNPNKPSKKRLLFVAAARRRCPSLNHKLLEGPDLLQLLPGFISRFRE